MGNDVSVARAKIARAVRAGDKDAEREARVELTEAHLQQSIALIMAREHKPRQEALDRARALLVP